MNGFGQKGFLGMDRIPKSFTMGKVLHKSTGFSTGYPMVCAARKIGEIIFCLTVTPR